MTTESRNPFTAQRQLDDSISATRKQLLALLTLLEGANSNEALAESDAEFLPVLRIDQIRYRMEALNNEMCLLETELKMRNSVVQEIGQHGIRMHFNPRALQNFGRVNT